MRNLIFAVVCGLVSVSCKDKTEESASPTASASASAPASASVAASASASAKPPEPPFEEVLKTSKPLQIKTQEHVAGPIKVKAETCTLSDGNPVAPQGMGVFRAVRAFGDHMLIVTRTNTIKAYKAEKGATCKLTLDEKVGEAGSIKSDLKFEKLSGDDQGHLVASSGVFGAVRYKKDFTVDYKCTPRPGGYMVVHPSGKYAFGHFVNGAVAKIDFDATSCKSTEVDFINPAKNAGPFKMIDAMAFFGDLLLVGGSAGDTKQVFAFDKAGKEKFHFGSTSKTGASDDAFGWIHAITPCKPGICVLDSNYRRISVWDKEGKKHLTNVPLKDVLGLNYAWIPDMYVAKDATYLLADQVREDGKVYEGLVYRLSGL